MRRLLALVTMSAILTGIASGTPTRAGAAPHASEVLYTAVEVAAPAGFETIYVTDLNNLGQLCASAVNSADGKWHALRRTGTKWEDLGGGTPLALNDSGVCVGYDSLGAVKWVGATRIPLPVFSFARDINDSGDILMNTGGPSGDIPSILLADSTAVIIPPLNSEFPSILGRAINASRQVTGNSRISTDDLRPYRFENGATSDLNAGLDGSPEGLAEGINADGAVCGVYLDHGTPGFQACTWTEPGTVTLLPTPAARTSGSLGINDEGTVVGYVYDGKIGTAAVWNGGRFQNLDSVTSPASLGLNQAFRINNEGAILAMKHGPGKGDTYFILTPLPPNPLPDLRGAFGRLTAKCSGTGVRRQCTISGKLTVTNGGPIVRRFLKSKPTKLELFGSTDTNLGGDPLIKTITIPALKPGASKVLQVSGVKFARGVPAAGKYLIGVIDGAGQVAELDETNNTFVSTALP